MKNLNLRSWQILAGLLLTLPLAAYGEIVESLDRSETPLPFVEPLPDITPFEYREFTVNGVVHKLDIPEGKVGYWVKPNVYEPGSYVVAPKGAHVVWDPATRAPLVVPQGKEAFVVPDGSGLKAKVIFVNSDEGLSITSTGLAVALHKGQVAFEESGVTRPHTQRKTVDQRLNLHFVRGVPAVDKDALAKMHDEQWNHLKRLPTAAELEGQGILINSASGSSLKSGPNGILGVGGAGLLGNGNPDMNQSSDLSPITPHPDPWPKDDHATVGPLWKAPAPLVAGNSGAGASVSAKSVDTPPESTPPVAPPPAVTSAVPVVAAVDLAAVSPPPPPATLPPAPISPIKPPEVEKPPVAKPSVPKPPVRVLTKEEAELEALVASWKVEKGQIDTKELTDEERLKELEQLKKKGSAKTPREHPVVGSPLVRYLQVFDPYFDPSKSEADRIAAFDKAVAEKLKTGDCFVIHRGFMDISESAINYSMRSVREKEKRENSRKQTEAELERFKKPDASLSKGLDGGLSRSGVASYNRSQRIQEILDAETQPKSEEASARSKAELKELLGPEGLAELKRDSEGRVKWEEMPKYYKMAYAFELTAKLDRFYLEETGGNQEKARLALELDFLATRALSKIKSQCGGKEPTLEDFLAHRTIPGEAGYIGDGPDATKKVAEKMNGAAGAEDPKAEGREGSAAPDTQGKLKTPAK